MQLRAIEAVPFCEIINTRRLKFVRVQFYRNLPRFIYEKLGVFLVELGKHFNLTMYKKIMTIQFNNLIVILCDEHKIEKKEVLQTYLPILRKIMSIKLIFYPVFVP